MLQVCAHQNDQSSGTKIVRVRSLILHERGYLYFSINHNDSIFIDKAQ